jgi:hypothetical protein
MPQECVTERMPPFQALIDRYTPAAGKLHIADLPNDQKEELRADVFRVIKESRLPCFWYAIHVAGLHAWYLSTEKVRAEAAQSRKESTVKRGSARPKPESLHVHLFGGLYAHLIAFLEERQRKEVHIEIRSDQIDGPIIKEFEETARRLLSTNPIVSNVSGFDTITKSVVHGKVTMEIKLLPDMEIEMIVRSMSINPVQSGDGLVLAADVLANSLNHLFGQRSGAALYQDLNTPEAVASHPLAEHLDSFVNWGHGDLVGDALFRHPKAPKV